MNITTQMSYLQKDDAETWLSDMHSLPHKHEIRPQVFFQTTCTWILVQPNEFL